MEELLRIFGVVGFAIMLGAAAIAWWQFRPWLSLIVVLLYFFGFADGEVRHAALRFSHDTLVDRIDDTLTPAIERKLEDLEDRISRLE